MVAGVGGALLIFQADVVKILRVPQSHEVAPQVRFVVRIANAGEKACQQSLAANAAIAFKLDSFHDPLRLRLAWLGWSGTGLRGDLRKDRRRG
jgi:hypothetical protein